MKILVCAKRVVDSNVKVKLKADHSDVDVQFCKMSLNPFDENAIEESVRLKESGRATEIVAISIGNAKCADTLRTALAMGCDRAILVETDLNIEPIMVANILKHITLQEQPDLIFMGKQATDDDANQVGQMLAGMLDYPQGTFISKLEFVNTDAAHGANRNDQNAMRVRVEREIDNGTETLEITLPAVLTADLHLNEPRFVKLPQIMLARKKPLQIIKLEDLPITYRTASRVIGVTDGETKKTCKFIHTTDEIVTILAGVK